ncbi:MAG: transcription termination/antitermination protein NusA [Luteitalea sp.]|nr:transcription termination/antitermination protein NusA [Luteitalea sp.]
MSNPLLQTIESLAKEKGIDPQLVISAIEEAVATASRKAYKTGENLKARLNPDTGDVDLFAVKEVVESVTSPLTEMGLDDAQTMYRELYGEEYAAAIEVGDEIEFPKSKEPLGRIAAQTAKQVIFQKVREAERENIYEEYSQRVGEVVTATVKRFETGDIVVEIGRVEASLPRREQSRAENYSVGDRVRAVIKSVNKNVKGPQIVLSRTDPALLVKLFEQEVPEIYDGTVMIRGAVREAGDRAKVAVYSRERDVDPVGACVGMKGTRVQAIIRELRGEKIDIVEWSDEPVEFVTNGISPARVQRVSIVDEAEKVMEVIVEDKQLSLAIGKKGQNVRLAAKLTGWKIDIKSEEEKRKEVEAQLEGLAREPVEAAEGPEAGPEVGPDAGPEAGPDAGPEAGPDAGPEASIVPAPASSDEPAPSPGETLEPANADAMAEATTEGMPEAEDPSPAEDSTPSEEEAVASAAEGHKEDTSNRG